MQALEMISGFGGPSMPQEKILLRQFFCIGPGALPEGDFIAILLDADASFVIREVFDNDDEEESLRRRRGGK